MNKTSEKAKALREQIIATEEELQRLKEQLASVEAQNDTEDIQASVETLTVQDDENTVVSGSSKWPLSSEEYKRYGRQMIVPSIGIQGLIPPL